MPTLTEIRNLLEVKENYVLAIQAQVKSPTDPTDVQFLRADALKHLPTEAAAREKMLALHAELKDLRQSFDDAVRLDDAEKALAESRKARESIDKPMVHSGQATQEGRRPVAKSFGQQAVEAGLGKKQGATGPELELPDVELKTLMTTAAGFAPESTRTARIEELILRPLQFLDLVPSTETTMAAVRYMRQLTGPNAAAETAEGIGKPEAEMTFEEVLEAVRKIAEWLPVTDEQLEDVPFLQSMIDDQLRGDLLLRLDGQMLVGNGAAPNLRGILNVVGIQTQALGADTALDAIYKALVKIRVTARSIPNVVAIHSTNWSPVRLATAAGSGMYLYGPPYDAGPERVWGVPVVMNEALTAGTAVAGDTRRIQLAYRRGVAVQVSNSHSDYFIKNLQAIRAELRVAFLVYRPSAWCTITGLAA